MLHSNGTIAPADRWPVSYAHANRHERENEFNDTLAPIAYNLVDSPEKNFYMINVQEVEWEDIIENLLNPGAFAVLVADSEFNEELSASDSVFFQENTNRVI